jgi:hypothetical protein
MVGEDTRPRDEELPAEEIKINWRVAYARVVGEDTRPRDGELPAEEIDMALFSIDEPNQ